MYQLINQQEDHSSNALKHQHNRLKLLSSIGSKKLCKKINQQKKQTCKKNNRAKNQKIKKLTSFFVDTSFSDDDDDVDGDDELDSSVVEEEDDAGGGGGGGEAIISVYND